MSALPSIAPDTGRPTEADAAADLYARHSSRIFGYCLGLLRNREEAEDAVQTTFLNAYRGLRRGVEPEFEAAWLFKIAQNVCRTRRENAWRRGRVETARDLDALQDVVAAPEQASGQAAELTAALNALPERYRTIILLREWHGLSYREIAAETGLSEGSVEMLVFRARRALAEQLQGDGLRTRALSLSSVLSLLKSLLGGAGLKAAATAVAVTATAIAVATVPSDESSTVRPTGVTPTVDRTIPAVAPSPATARLLQRGASPAAAVSSGDRPGTGQAAAPPTSQAAAGGKTGAQPPSAAPPSPPASSAPPPASVSAPSVAPPAVSAPSVTVPGTSVSTPTVTVPSPSLPEAPPLPVDPPQLPIDPPDLPLP